MTIPSTYFLIFMAKNITFHDVINIISFYDLIKKNRFNDFFDLHYVFYWNEMYVFYCHILNYILFTKLHS